MESSAYTVFDQQSMTGKLYILYPVETSVVNGRMETTCPRMPKDTLEEIGNTLNEKFKVNLFAWGHTFSYFEMSLVDKDSLYDVLRTIPEINEWIFADATGPIFMDNGYFSTTGEFVIFTNDPNRAPVQDLSMLREFRRRYENRTLTRGKYKLTFRLEIGNLDS